MHVHVYVHHSTCTCNLAWLAVASSYCFFITWRFFNWTDFVCSSSKPTSDSKGRGIRRQARNHVYAGTSTWIHRTIIFLNYTTSFRGTRQNSMDRNGRRYSICRLCGWMYSQPGKPLTELEVALSDTNQSVAGRKQHTPALKVRTYGSTVENQTDDVI